MDLDLQATLLVFAASVLASVISGIFGMAGGMVLMGIYSAILPVTAAMILHGITQFASNGFRWFLLRSHTYWRGILPYALGVLIAATAFWLIDFIPNQAIVFLVLGGIPFAAALLPPSWRLDFAKPSGPPAAGMAVSAIQLMAGAAGPALDVFFIDTKMTKNEIVATKALTQTLAHLTKIIYFAMIVRQEHVPSIDFAPSLIVGSVVCTFVGTTIGSLILRRFSDAQFKMYTRRIVLTLGAYYLYRGAMAL